MKHIGKNYWQGNFRQTSYNQCILYTKYIFGVSVNIGEENFGK